MVGPEVKTGIGPAPVVSEASNATRPVASVVERAPVVGNRPVEQVGGLRPAAETVVGPRPTAPAAQEVRPTPAPVK